jgi:hypothetical protein
MDWLDFNTSIFSVPEFHSILKYPLFRAAINQTTNPRTSQENVNVIYTALDLIYNDKLTYILIFYLYFFLDIVHY